MKVGIIELLVDTAYRGWVERLYATYFRRQFISITPQAVAVWCRQLGHRVTYATYYGQQDPKSLLPDDLDVVFISAYTQASALASALAKLYRRAGVFTVMGGPHAKSFPLDCLRFFDLAVKECDKELVDDILRRRFDPPAVVSSGRTLRDFPSVEERMPEIAVSAFHRGRPFITSLVPMLASVGCPYDCDFCIDWNTAYFAVPAERLRADLAYLSDHLPGVLVGYHDPNFAVRFEETMDLIETLPEGRRNPYIMESSLSILKESRLHRLRATNCVYVAPGIESWADYSEKAGASGRVGRVKLEKIVGHLRALHRSVSGIQANFLFGADVDEGREPVELTKEFIRRLPEVWPTVNIPTPFGGTPLFDKYRAEGRILRSLPFAFYYVPYLAATLRHYDAAEYYDHLIDMHQEIVSTKMLARRLATRSHPAVRFVHALRTFGTRSDLAEFRRVRKALASDPGFRAFHEGRTERLPEFYHWRFEQRLGPYAELVSRAERIPVLDQAPEPAAERRPAALPQRAAAAR